MRLHLVNRHKINNNMAREIMQNMKPDIDLSLKPVWQQQAYSESGEFDGGGYFERVSFFIPVVATGLDMPQYSQSHEWNISWSSVGWLLSNV